MSQMVTRKRTGGDEKEQEKRTDSPVKDMKKKMAANAEKEKNAAEKASDKPEKALDKSEKAADKSEKASDKSEKPVNKPADKLADKSTDKPTNKPADKPADKSTDKPTNKPADKTADKLPEKPADKSTGKPKSSEKVPEKLTEKKDAQNEKKKEDGSKGESSGKPERPAQRVALAKQNGSNGVNGTVSADSDSDELVMDEPDELFPELAYEDSDEEPEHGLRSLTRRSQVKPTRTPETPPTVAARPPTADDSKDYKVLKLSQESKNDSPKPETKKADAKSDAKKPEIANTKESPKTDAKKGDKEAKDADGKKVTETPKKDGEASKNKEDKDKVEYEVVVEIESLEPASSRKPDTNFSKSRVKVSPYRRSLRLADQTMTSVTANYTGNNTTMETDITESSSLLDATLDATLDDSYLAGLRAIRGRRSYKLLKDLEPRPLSRSALGASFTVSEPGARPTGTVVGRKRRPEAAAPGAPEGPGGRDEEPPAGKRQRLLERLARPFRRAAPPALRDAQIVGINTDLPLSAPVAAAATFDPEALKPAPAPSGSALAPAPAAEDPKRCVVM